MLGIHAVKFWAKIRPSPVAKCCFEKEENRQQIFFGEQWTPLPCRFTGTSARGNNKIRKLKSQTQLVPFRLHFTLTSIKIINKMINNV